MHARRDPSIERIDREAKPPYIKLSFRHPPYNPEAGNPLTQARLLAAVCHGDVCHPSSPPQIHRFLRFLHRFGFSSEVDHCGDHLIACTRVEDPIPPIKLSHFLMPKGNAVCCLAGRRNGRGERDIGGWWRLKKAGRKNSGGNWSEGGGGRGGERIEPLVEIRH